MTPRQTNDVERAKKAGVTKRSVLEAIMSRQIDVDEAIWLRTHPGKWLERLIFKYGLSFADARRFAVIKNRFDLGHGQTLRLLRGEMTRKEATRVITRYRNTTVEASDQPIPPELLSLAYPATSSDKNGDMFDHGSRMHGHYGSTQ